MLVITRCEGERLVVGDLAVVVEVVTVQPGKVKLGVTAPGYSIHREETYESIRDHPQEGGKTIYQPGAGS